MLNQVTVSDDRRPRLHLGPQRLILDLQPPLAQGVADDEHRLLERERLLDEIERTHLDCADGRLDIAMPGDHDDL